MVKFKCNLCSSKFPKLDEFKGHIKKVHDTEMKIFTTQNQKEHNVQFVCKSCDKIANQKNYIITHYKRVHLQ